MYGKCDLKGYGRFEDVLLILRSEQKIGVIKRALLDYALGYANLLLGNPGMPGLPKRRLAYPRA